MENSLDRQIAGQHYKSGYQPVQLYADLNLNAFQANVIKYLTRLGKKDPLYRPSWLPKYVFGILARIGKKKRLERKAIEDLDKAIHYCQLAKELGVSEEAGFPCGLDVIQKTFCSENRLCDISAHIIKAVHLSLWDAAERELQFLQVKYKSKYKDINKEARINTKK